MKIGIIGAGNIGGNLTRRLTALGHEVVVANSRGPQTLEDLAEETGATAALASVAAAGAELVIVTIPERAIPLLPAGILDGAAPGAPIIDTGNYYPKRDGRIAEIEDGMTESRWVSTQLGHPVIKTFNNIYAQSEAKAVVMRLVGDLGFDPVDAGGIDDSWRQQPGTPVYGTDLDAAGVREALRQASPERPPGFRA
jgi:hypothetical protein